MAGPRQRAKLYLFIQLILIKLYIMCRERAASKGIISVRKRGLDMGVDLNKGNLILSLIVLIVTMRLQAGKHQSSHQGVI